MVEDLLNAKKISPEFYELYMLFQANELGRKVLARMTREAFMDEPKPTEWSGEGFAFFDGRRSLIRDIHGALTFIEEALKEQGNDNGRQQPEQ